MKTLRCGSLVGKKNMKVVVSIRGGEVSPTVRT